MEIIMKQDRLIKDSEQIKPVYNKMKSTKVFNVTDVVSAYYFTKKPRFEPQVERYDFSQIMLILDGEGVYRYGDTTYNFSPGMMFYRPAGRSSIYEWSTDNASLALISFVCDAKEMSAFEAAPISLYEAEKSILLDVIKTCVRICEPLKYNEPLSGMRIKEGTPSVAIGYVASSLERFLSMLYCRCEGIDLLVDESQKVSVYADSSELVSKVKEYLEEHVSRQLLIDNICTHFGVSRTLLTKRFRTETGSSVMEYFNRIKIDEAKALIREGSLSFSAIAERLGFASSGYFSKVFYKHTGMTPTQYSKYASKRRIIK